jgi:hypothetical protein
MVVPEEVEGRGADARSSAPACHTGSRRGLFHSWRIRDNVRLRAKARLEK